MQALAQHGAAYLSEGGDDAGVARGNGRDAGEQQKHGENDCEQDGDESEFFYFFHIFLLFNNGKLVAEGRKLNLSAHAVRWCF